MKWTSLYLFFYLVALGHTLHGQSEDALKKILEGKRVKVLIEMPASSEGIDVYADKPVKMDFEDYSKKVKSFGVAIYPGEVVMITKIKKKSKHIEFQLAGGGFGTFGDDTGTVFSRSIAKSSREEELEKLLSDGTKRADKDDLQKELDDLRRKRRLEQDRADRDAALQNEMKKSRIASQRKEGGSRFNIRFDYKIDDSDMTFELVKNALDGYVDFSPGEDMNTEESTNSGSATSLQKGISMSDAIALLGIPKDLSTEEACGFEKSTCVFETEDSRIETIFIEKILVKCTISSR